MQYSRYSSYRDSGVEWLGDVPEHWETSRLKFLCNITTGGKDTENKVDDGEYPFYVRSQTVERINSYSFNGEAILTAGDGVGVGKVFHYTNGKFDFHQRVYMFYAFKNTAGKFLFEYIKNNFYKVALAGVAKSTVDSLRLPLIQNFMITVPPLQEQKTIANYLDTATAKIDTLIEKQTRLIELLKEKRQAVISTAVTRGLDSTVAMKDSGVEWLGEIPEGWTQTPLRYIGRLQNGISKGGDYFGSGFPFVNYGDIYNNSTLPLHVSGLAKSTKEDQHAYSVQKGDIFFTRTSETIDDIGMASTCLQTIKNATFSGFTIRFRQLKQVLNENFSKYCFRTGHAQAFFEEQLNLVTRASLGQDILKQLPVLLPPMKEQQDIATYLDDKTSKIDTLTTKATKAIELLKEKRTALISSVVTGKIDVRDEV
jgi:type I restriction enzyme S subunit